MLWIVRTGAPWRDFPETFGKWSTVYQRFRRWTNAGVFDRIFEATRGALNLQTVQVDGSFIKGHQHATGAPKGAARPMNPSASRRSGRLAAGSNASSHGGG